MLHNKWNTKNKSVNLFFYLHLCEERVIKSLTIHCLNTLMTLTIFIKKLLSKWIWSYVDQVSWLSKLHPSVQCLAASSSFASYVNTLWSQFWYNLISVALTFRQHSCLPPIYMCYSRVYLIIETCCIIKIY